MGQKTTDSHGTKQICHTPDLTRAYHNLLFSCDEQGNSQNYLWDGTAAATTGTEGEGILHQDMSGSTRVLAGPAGNVLECYDYDEFGIPQGSPQSILSDVVSGNERFCNGLGL